jgi:hypothetical protein
MATLLPIDSIPTTQSFASEWVEWHKALKTRYGIAAANTMWLKAWRERGNDEANTADLRDYIASQGIEIDGGIWDFVPDTFDSIGDTFTQVFSVGKWVVLAVVVILVVFLAMLAFNIGKNPHGTIAAVGKLKGGIG